MENNNLNFDEINKKLQDWREKRWKKQDERYEKRNERIRNRSFVVNALLFLPQLIGKLLKFLINFCIILLIISTIIGSIIFIKVYPKLKEARETGYDKLINCTPETFQLLSNTLIYDKDGNIIGEINSGNFEYVKIDDISKYLSEGYICVEDKNFKSHPGIDIEAIARASYSLVKHKGKITQGASTITQQVVKNNLLSNEQTYFRKITEIFMALDLEKEFTKAQIMEFYLNTNFYGNNCYGVGAASHYYFNKTPSELTIAESATLIGISNAPSAYDPVRQYEKCMRKKNIVLDTMYKNNVITKEEYDAAKAEEIKIVQADFENASQTSYQTTYAIYCATIHLMEKDGFEFKYIFDNKEQEDKYREEYNEEYSKFYNKITNGGYKIYTSLDSNVQNMLQTSIDDELSKYSEVDENGKYLLQSAAVCIDNNTNYVLAVVGGRSGSGEYNRAYQAYRQPGSSIKPLLDYGPAFDTGLYYPSLIMEDKQLTGDYAPKNAGGGYSGRVNIKTAITKSINTIAYQCFDGIGIDYCLGYLEKLQFSNISFADRYNSAISLGGFTNGVSPVDMAKGYNALASGGAYSDRTCIVSISDINGEVYNSKKETTKRIYSEDTAYLLTDCLINAVEHGTGTNAKVNNQIIAGKTGTTNMNKDAWFCGYSQYFTTTVWIGYDTPQSMNGIYGGKLPAKIFSSFMTKISDGKEMVEFKRPETIVEKDIDAAGRPLDEITYDEFGNPISSGTSLFSTINTSGLSEAKLKEQQELIYNNALKKLEEFEAFTITDINSAMLFEQTYSDTKQAVYLVEDETLLSNLVKRLNEKYSILLEIYKKYEPTINEQKEASQEQLRQSQLENDQQILQELNNASQSEAKSNADYYISILDSKTTYDEEAIRTIELLRDAVSKLEGTAFYDEYVTKQNIAIQRIQGL